MHMPVYIIGDIHGHYEKLINLLVRARIIDDHLSWSGGSAVLWFMGDFFDRGAQGIDVVELIMRLQGEAVAGGGRVNALLGNHEVLFLGAHRFPQKRNFVLNWKRNGGQDTDMQQVTARHIAWLRNLPAMALVENRLFMHADAMFYQRYGSNIAEVNENLRLLLSSDHADSWDQLLDDFAERMTFVSSDFYGSANATQMLNVYGGQQIIHGHTPIQYLSDTLSPNEPVIYARNLCIDVDGGIYLGGKGFVYRMVD